MNLKKYSKLGRGKKPAHKCENCKCERYTKCYCKKAKKK